MSLTNPNKIVTEERLSDFYNRILPYLGGNDANSVPYDNTDSGLTSENVQDAIDELNESKASPLTNAEMTAIKNAFDATNTSKFAITYTKYTTDEQIVGEWIDGKPIYQKSFSTTTPAMNAGDVYIDTGLSIDSVVDIKGTVYSQGYQWRSIPFIFNNLDNNTLKSIQVGLHSNSAPNNPNKLRLFDNLWGERPIVITIQYTKTTD